MKLYRMSVLILVGMYAGVLQAQAPAMDAKHGGYYFDASQIDYRALVAGPPVVGSGAGLLDLSVVKHAQEIRTPEEIKSGAKRRSR